MERPRPLAHPRPAAGSKGTRWSLLKAPERQTLDTGAGLGSALEPDTVRRARPHPARVPPHVCLVTSAVGTWVAPTGDRNPRKPTEAVVESPSVRGHWHPRGHPEG